MNAQPERRLLFLLLRIIAVFLAFWATGPGQARGDTGAADQTLAPYFFIPGEAGGADTMPLKSTTVEVKVAGVVADVRIRQVYRNAGAVPLEAVYLFPGSTRAAVYGMEMRIGERVLKAQVQERTEARRTYETAKAEGKRGSLLEQQRPNVFQMNVANILPGEEVAVDLRYTEPLIPEAGEYAFVFPTVVGPRYGGRHPAGALPPQQAWVSNPYLAEGVPSPATFDITVDLATGIPIQNLQSPSHKIKPEFHGEARASIALLPGEPPGNDRDFILKYRLADRKIEAGLLLSREEKENFFALMVEPPRRITPAQIPPREYTFVVDVSGSMSGFPLETAKALFRELAAGLRPVDRFNVLQFSGGNSLLSPTALAATPENLRRACDTLDREHGGGGTELLPALERVLSLPADEAASRSIVVITDGYVSCEPEAFELIGRSLNRANLFAFGIGSSVNRFLIEGMARAGHGEPFIVTHPREVREEVAKFVKYVSAPVLTRIAVSTPGFDTYEVEPRSVPDLLGERPLVIFGKWRGEARGEIVLKGMAGDGEWVHRVPVAEAVPVSESRALAHLWARSRIATLSDQIALGSGDTKERVREVTSLGLTYNLLTAYTSFVAVDATPARQSGELTTAKQPLPLPQGVSANAVGASAIGGSLPTTPEPETWAMLALLAAIIAWNYWMRKGRSCA